MQNYYMQPSLQDVNLSGIGETPPASSTNWGADIKSAGGMLSSLSSMGVGGAVGAGLGAMTGTGPIGMAAGGAIGSIIDKGLSLWQSNKAANAQKRYLEKRQKLNDKLLAAQEAQRAKEFAMSYGLQRERLDLDTQQQGFSQMQTAAEYRQRVWAEYLTRLQNRVTNNMNLRQSLISTGVI